MRSFDVNKQNFKKLFKIQKKTDLSYDIQQLYNNLFSICKVFSKTKLHGIYCVIGNKQFFFLIFDRLEFVMNNVIQHNTVNETFCLTKPNITYPFK